MAFCSYVCLHLIFFFPPLLFVGAKSFSRPLKHAALFLKHLIRYSQNRFPLTSPPPQNSARLKVSHTTPPPLPLWRASLSRPKRPALSPRILALEISASPRPKPPLRNLPPPPNPKKQTPLKSRILEFIRTGSFPLLAPH